MMTSFLNYKKEEKEGEEGEGEEEKEEKEEKVYINFAGLIALCFVWEVSK